MKPNVISDHPSRAKPRTRELARLGYARDPDKGLEHPRRLEEAPLKVSAARVLLRHRLALRRGPYGKQPLVRVADDDLVAVAGLAEDEIQA